MFCSLISKAAKTVSTLGVRQSYDTTSCTIGADSFSRNFDKHRLVGSILWNYTKKEKRPKH